jgi:hypothetical protein
MITEQQERAWREEGAAEWRAAHQIDEMRQDMEIEMTHASFNMRVDEMLADASADYRRGFFDAWDLICERNKRICDILNR